MRWRGHNRHGRMMGSMMLMPKGWGRFEIRARNTLSTGAIASTSCKSVWAKDIDNNFEGVPGMACFSCQACQRSAGLTSRFLSHEPQRASFGVLGEPSILASNMLLSSFILAPLVHVLEAQAATLCFQKPSPDARST